jgi:ectoine hydroxylase-related dioxygenase (phytanoyl-CoA dioxygenase family)
VKKYRPGDSDANEAFVKEGFVIYKDVYDIALIEKTRKTLFKWYERLAQICNEGKIEEDVNGWAISIMEKYEKTNLYESFITNPNTLAIMQSYMGPDICALGYDAFWINVPKDKDPVLSKGQHSEAWTGTSVYSVFAKTFFTDVDKYNGMSVSPGSHLQGLTPVKNRAIDPMYNLEFENVNIDFAKMGDLLLWHPLLVHATTGHSDKNIRMSITSRFTSTETPFSTQERALGYRPLSVGPLNQVLRFVGNDQLLPLRTYGGFVGVDRRMSKIYGYSDYKKNVDYTEFLED